jgi:plasmid replication initiation protein
MSQMAKPKVVEPKTDKPLVERHVNMSNALARSAHGLNLTEKRVIACGLASTDSKSPRAYNQVMVHGGWLIRLIAVDYAETMGIEPKTAYEQLKEAASTLIKKQWTIIDGKTVTRYNWLSRMKYHEGEGWVELEFTHHTAPHLLALQNHFTSYKLKQSAALRSVYSWRLLECLESWKSTGRWTPTIEEFCRAMDAKASHRSNFGMLRRSVIEPSIRELRDKDGFNVDWKPIKSGRKVTSLEFSFEKSKQGRFDV